MNWCIEDLVCLDHRETGVRLLVLCDKLFFKLWLCVDVLSARIFFSNFVRNKMSFSLFHDCFIWCIFGQTVSAHGYWQNHTQAVMSQHAFEILLTSVENWWVDIYTPVPCKH